MNNENQVDKVLDKLPQPLLNSSTEPGAKRVVLASILSEELNGEQEEAMTEYILRRIDQTEDEIGRKRLGGDSNSAGNGFYNSSGQFVNIGNNTDFDGPWGDHLSRRDVFDAMFRDDVYWRKMGTSGWLDCLWQHSNLSLPFVRRICRQMIAKAVRYFFGTDPWFSAYPVGTDDADKAEKIGKHSRWKIDQAKVREAMETAMERAFVLGESVVKHTWKTSIQYFKKYERVMISMIDGQPILSQAQEYIYETDAWIAVKVPDRS